jgi:HEAT repeat protein
MPTEIEVRVMRLLSHIEIPADAPARIERMGTEAVTVVCEAALGTLDGVRKGIRHNAAAIVGRMQHEQAVETLVLLINDASPDVSLRAIRAVRRRRLEHVIPQIDTLLSSPSTPPVLAGEAVRALEALDTDDARRVLDGYRARHPDRSRGSTRRRPRA